MISEQNKRVIDRVLVRIREQWPHECVVYFYGELDRYIREGRLIAEFKKTDVAYSREVGLPTGWHPKD